MNTRTWYRWRGPNLELRIRAQPRAGTSRIDEPADDALRARLQAPPAAGKANRALIDLLADAFAVPRRRVCIRRGVGSRTKLVCIERPQAIPDSLSTHIRRPRVDLPAAGV